MNFNPQTKWDSGQTQQIPYVPPSTAVNAGDVLVLNGIAHFAESDIPVGALGALTFAGAKWAGSKAAGAWTLYAPVYWDTAATPNVASINAGAFTQVATSTSVFVGYCEASPVTNAAAATGDQYGYFVKWPSAVGGNAGGVVAAITATGSVASNSAPLAVGTNIVTGQDGTKGVTLPAAATGLSVRVVNASTKTLPVWPAATGVAINALSAGTDIAMAGSSAAEFVCSSTTQWYTIPTLPS